MKEKNMKATKTLKDELKEETADVLEEVGDGMVQIGEAIGEQADELKKEIK